MIETNKSNYKSDFSKNQNRSQGSNRAGNNTPEKQIIIEPEWITSGIGTADIEKISEIGNLISYKKDGTDSYIEYVSSTQLNNIFRNFKRLLQVKNNLEQEIAQMWISFAYQVAKVKHEEKNKTLYIEKLYESFKNCLDYNGVSGEEPKLITKLASKPTFLQNFVKIWEALLSYHNYFEQSKK